MSERETRIRTLRQELQEALDETRDAIREDAGRITRRAWTVPLIAGGLGFLAALVISRGRRSRRSRVRG
ncbi:MAG TPA: hypothetical protein VMV46_17985 [Thermoanaerobaculia bacterium]|nr:hypothetical protein [Thermoanaerobaculia bacterium]